jgi:very-short-patch-repair endonuclease
MLNFAISLNIRKGATVFQTSHCVDFLWRSGRLIVEIDSYYHHSRQEQFANQPHV